MELQKFLKWALIESTVRLFQILNMCICNSQLVQKFECLLVKNIVEKENADYDNIFKAYFHRIVFYSVKEITHLSSSV